ncbi:amino acid permease [Enterococcus faecalis 13-SD-W-01]|nr:amino acid permease [Enterococcus faecalis 13-SD-W-01]
MLFAGTRFGKQLYNDKGCVFMVEKKFDLLTTISMIVGICIGSGIFFKADNVLRDAQGNVLIGILLFFIGAFSIIFGSLTLSQLSTRAKKSGGLVGYFEEFYSGKMGTAFAWFQFFLYLPTINVIVSWVAGIYTLQLLGYEGTLELQIIIAIFYLTFFHVMNHLSMILGARFQKFSTFVKLIPLIFVAVLGIVTMNVDTEAVVHTTPEFANVGRFGWLAALGSVAFSYDGWTVILNISSDVDKPKKNIPKALIIGPLIVFFVYILYFIGLTEFLGVNAVLEYGQNSIFAIGERIFGNLGGQIILIFVLISILGVCNGMTIGALKMPEVLRMKNMLPKTKKQASKTSNVMLSYGICLFWMAIHYLAVRFDFFQGGDISELAITFSYACYVLLYARVITLYKNKTITSKFYGLVSPIFGMMGSSIILFGSFITSPWFSLLFFAFCLGVSLLGYFFYKKPAVDSQISDEFSA